MDIANWLRKRLNLPVMFDLDAEVEKARDAAHYELNRLSDPTLLVEVARWEHKGDPWTDGFECDQHPRELR